MSKWEDIVKDKLEGYESKLPEGSLAEFRALRAGAGSARPKRRSPVVWAAAAAVAAGLAAVLFLRQPQATNETVAPVVAETVDTPTIEPETIESSLPVQPLLAQAARPKAAGSAAVGTGRQAQGGVAARSEARGGGAGSRASAAGSAPAAGRAGRAG